MILFLAVIIYSCNDEPIEPIEEVTKSNETITSRQDEIEGFEFMDPCEAAQITYFIDESCISSINHTAIVEAITAYNNVPGTSINMTPTVSAESATINFTCDESSTAACGGGATTDIGETNGTEVFLLNSWGSCPCTDDTDDCNYTGDVSACMLLRTAMHEIGHALGIEHNGEGIQIDGTPLNGNDPLSIFNGGSVDFDNCNWCTAPCEFTAGDILAIQTLYPEPGPCECPELVTDFCDCPELITVPCQCPELFPEEVEVICYCTCRGWFTDQNGNIQYWRHSKSEVPCDQIDENCESITSTNGASGIECTTSKVCSTIIPVEDPPEKICYCVCTGWWTDQNGNQQNWDHSKTEIDCDESPETSCRSTDNGQTGIDCVIVRQ